MDVIYWIFILTFMTFSDCFNIDTNEAITYSGKTGSHFGASTELLSNQDEKWLLVGATKDNFTDMPQIVTPGNVYKCPINVTVKSGTGCVAMDLRTRENTDIPDAPGIYEQTTQYLGSTIVIGQKSIVACAPSWKNLREFSSIGAYTLTGHCHEITPDLETITPKLFRIDISELNTNGRTFYAAAEIGFSSTATDNPVFSVILGHPNTYNGAGGFSYYIEDNTGIFLEKYSVLDGTDLQNIFMTGAYMGYAVASGTFGTGPAPKPHVVVGAPGFANEKGTVGTVALLEVQSSIQVLKQVTGTDQIGSGLGQSLCVADVNGDNIHDILAGAPLESVQEVEMGAVYVYYGTGDSNYIRDTTGTFQQLHGMKKYRSRFGTAISNLGDINLNGYNDIAIGAPYEDDFRGAIYIFNGNNGVMNPIYSQRIEASSIDNGLRGFGFDISKKSIDIDDNQYPDLSVGAYLSDSTVILRSRPLVNIDSFEFTVSPTVIPLNSSGLECSTGVDTNPCVTVMICLRFSGTGVDNTVLFDYSIDADIKQKQNKKSSRVQFYYENTNRGDRFTRQSFSVPKNTRSCEKVYARVKSVGREFFAAIQDELTFEVSFQLSDMDTPGSIKPLLNNLVQTNRTASANFETGCSALTCRPDLTVLMEISNTEIVLGETNELLAEVVVRNQGEPSFATSVIFETSNNTVFRGFTVLLDRGSERLNCVPETDQANQTFTRCSFDNPVFQLQFGLFRVRFDVSRDLLLQGPISGILKTVEIKATAITAGEVNAADNTVTKTSIVTLKGGLLITGTSNPEQARLTVDKNAYINVVQIYSIENQGPSDIPQALVYFQIPVRSTTAQMVERGRLRVTYGAEQGEGSCSLMTFPGSLVQQTSTTTMSTTTTAQRQILVDESTTDNIVLPVSTGSVADSIPRRRKRDVNDEVTNVQTQENNVQSINCSSGSDYECALVACSIRNIHVQEYRLFTVAINVSEKFLPEFQQGATFIRYMTHGIVYPPKSSDIPVVFVRNSTTMVSIDIFPQVILQQVAELNIWIIVGGCLGGLVLFILLGLLLYKLGFFKREKKKQIDAYKRQSQAFKRQSRMTMRGAKSPDEKAIVSESLST